MILRCRTAVCCFVVLLNTACSEPESGVASGEVAPAPPHRGEAVYHRYCFSCHAAGVAGAPRFGDGETWAPRVAKGMEQLLRSTIEGMPPGMPERGLCFDCSDTELVDAIDYMLVNNR